MKLAKILKESFNAPDSELEDQVRLMSYAEWDSMNHMLFIARLEEEYAVELTGDEIAEMQTVGDIKKVIVSKGKQV